MDNLEMDVMAVQVIEWLKDCPDKKYRCPVHIFLKMFAEMYLRNVVLENELNIKREYPDES